MKRDASDRGKVLEVLRGIKPTLKEKYGVTRLGVFGSVARDEATETSDVDVVIEMERPNLFTMVNIKEELEDALDKPVDLIRYKQKMNIFLKTRIDREAMYV